MSELDNERIRKYTYLILIFDIDVDFFTIH